MARIAVRLLAWVWTRVMNDHSRTGLMWALNAKFTVAASAVLLDDANRALLVRGAADGAWQLPRVYLRRREVPEEAISQAIESRTGIVAETVLPVTIQVTTPPHLEVLYAGRAIAGQLAVSGGTWRWCAAEDVPPSSAAAVRAATEAVQAFQSPAGGNLASEPHLAAG